MESDGEEQYSTSCIDDMDEGMRSNVSYEEVCEPVDEIILQGNLSNVFVDDVSKNITEAEVTEIITVSSEDVENQSSIIHSIYGDKKTTQQFNTGDESMAVEALRELGGLYSCSETKQFPNCVFKQTETVEYQSECRYDEYACNICEEKFKRRTDLSNHMACHEVDYPHACRVCGNLFRSKASLQLHMTNVHLIKKSYKCDVCGVNFQRPSSLSNHAKIHSYIAGRALVQDKNNLNSFGESYRTISDSKETSVRTTKVESLQNSESPHLQWAVQTYTLAIDQDNIEDFTNQKSKIDTLQEFTVLSNGGFAQFEYTSENIKSKEEDKRYDPSFFPLINPKLRMNPVIMENENEKRTDKADIQENHDQSPLTFNRDYMSFKNDCNSPVECSYCDKQFQDEILLAKHQMNCMKKLKSSDPRASNVNARWGKHICSECGKKFTTKQKMFRHQWIHRKKKRICEFCSSQFEKQSDLDNHRLSVHPDDSPFTCVECGKSFVSRQGLWEHRRTHAGSPAYFQCETCSKTFSSRQGYLIHSRTHTGERPYGCKFCWKSFRDGGTLRKHERIHTGERPHVCPLCSRAFNQKVVLREHVRWVHAAGKNDRETNSRPFSCPLCTTETQDRDELCAHIVKHSDQIIAEARARNNALNQKSKLNIKQSKYSDGKIEHQSETYNKPTIISEQNQSSITTLKHETGTRNALLFIENEHEDSAYIKTLIKSNDIFQNKGETVNIITFTEAADQCCAEENIITSVLSRSVPTDSPQLMPSITPYKMIHLISANKHVDTLNFISRQNESSPVLAIPNPQHNDSLTENILLLQNCESSAGVKSLNNDMDNQETDKDAYVETVRIKPASIIFNSIQNTEITHSRESENRGEELICGICGDDFNNRNILTDHVKIHI